MKLKIDRHGSLYLERKGKMKQQQCPYNESTCGDWCPLFDDEILPEAMRLCHAFYGGFELFDERE